MWLIAAVVMILAAGSESRRLSHKYNNPQLEPKRCFCHVTSDNTTVLHDLGELSISTWFGGERMEQCNHFRRICKSKCRKTVDLDHALEGGAKLGYRLCAEHGRPNGRDGIQLWAQPVIKGCVRNRNPKPALVHRKLCCGHTTVQMSDMTSQTHVIMAFGWNPDCQASSFVLGP